MNLRLLPSSGVLGVSLALGAIHPVVGQTSDDSRFAYTRIFTQSPIFYGYCVSDDCTPTKEFSAFRQASRDHIDIVQYLSNAFQQATPAGRIYIAKSVQQHDAERAQQLFLRLKQDQRQVEILAGCMLERETIAVMAEELERNSFEDDLPDRPY